MNLRKWAKGKECQLRAYGICSYDDAETVWCHIRVGGVAGMGQKPPDICGALCCSRCHDLIDGRIKTDLTKVQIESHMLHAMVRSLKMAVDDGIVS